MARFNKGDRVRVTRGEGPQSGLFHGDLTGVVAIVEDVESDKQMATVRLTHYTLRVPRSKGESELWTPVPEDVLEPA